MLLAAVLVNRCHALLEQAEKALNRIRVHVAAHVFLG
jgi:hypothetical protein